MKRVTKVVAAVIYAACVSSASAAPIVIDGGPVFGAPINVSNTTSGTIINGGNTRIYAGAAASPVANVYFGLHATSLGISGVSGDGASISGGEVFSWFGETATSIEYRAQTTVPTLSGGPYTVYARLLVNAIGATVVDDATTQALTGVHSLLHLTGGSFTVTREIELSLNQSTWTDAQPMYNSLQFKPAGAALQTSVFSGFYWENNAPSNNAPEPTSMALVGVALLGLLANRARKG